MVKTLTVTVADHVYDEVASEIVYYNYSNRSEFVEELLRLGLLHWRKYHQEKQQNEQK